eukprot:scaffold955_cov54-Cyclotella_meneghiniana.AAC.3
MLSGSCSNSSCNKRRVDASLSSRCVGTSVSGVGSAECGVGGRELGVGMGRRLLGAELGVGRGCGIWDLGFGIVAFPPLL